MPRTEPGLDGCDKVSPIRPNKHFATPQRTKRKTSRREQGIDVHSSCSTPNSLSPQTAMRSFGSPSSSFPCSQDHPDVIWDFTSPKLPKGSKKREIKLTISELLENLNQCQVPECSSKAQPTKYMQLLENWMSKQKVDVVVKKTEKSKKVIKKQPRRLIEELRKFIETIPRLNEKENLNNPRQSDSSNKQDSDDANSSKLNISSKSFLGGDSTDNDSTDELWGDADNSFIVKATQELETVSNACTSNNLNREDVVSTIPETDPSAILEQRRQSSGNRLTLDEYNDFIEQLSNVDWDSDLDEWDNGFLIEEEAFSLIPEEVLTGSVLFNNTNVSDSSNSEEKTVNSAGENCELNVVNHSTVIKNIVKQPQTKKREKFSVNEFEVTVGTEAVQVNNELYNSFEDESFEDESILCQPDVLSRIDEVESLMSQQPRCTPEEIEKKKEEAIKRRKNKNRLRR
ncbi:uncharacterized protein TNIN_280171 [Trichonephila inaurata madagascariensis]|uniref:Uncharacterized protein n=1 Tax=Trichonephila inaurata madagascariensis TaxID=2747483 RepID=A0A8X6XIG6_9ARAC|nr:uncharacterized protein TNIN_280171 [Trichonephila inaurata madagascariensis]